MAYSEPLHPGTAYELTYRRVRGHLLVQEDGTIQIQPGTEAFATERTTTIQSYKALRDSLIADRRLVRHPTRQDMLVFIAPVSCRSLSEAASVCLGYAVNGRAAWRVHTVGADDKGWRDGAVKAVRSLASTAPTAWRDTLAALITGLEANKVPTLLRPRTKAGKP